MYVKKKLIFTCIILLLVFIISFPYIRAEYYTHRYGEAFSDAYLRTHMIDGIEYFKVTKYSKNMAEVVYIAEDHAYCILMILVPGSGGEWKMAYWDCIWSRSGSADGFMWPYYR